MVKQCILCNKIFDDFLDMHRLCPECREKEEDLLHQVKDYLWDYPGTTEGKLEELFGVTHKQVLKWLREERIEVTPASSIKLTCQRCGSMILTGRYCPDCAQRVGAELNELRESLKPKTQKKMQAMVLDRGMGEGGRMHILQNKSQDKKKREK